MTTCNYNVCNGVLGLRTHAKLINNWSFGQPSETISQEELEKCRVVMRYWHDPLHAAAARFSKLERYHNWFCEPGRDEIFYERRLHGASKLRMLARGIREGQPEIFANAPIRRYIRLRLINLHSPGYHLTDLACALLLKQGLCPLHCSGFSTGDQTVAVIAPPDTGKTLTTMHAILNAGANFISEDLAIIDGTNIYACPWTSTFRYYDEFAMSWRLKLRMRLVKVFPPIELVPPRGGFRKIDQYLAPERITTKARVSHIAFLARRTGGVKVLDKPEARRLLWNLNRYEFVWMKNPMLVAYSYFNPELDLRELVAREAELLDQLVDQAECLLVQSPDPTRFAPMIMEHLGK